MRELLSEGGVARELAELHLAPSFTARGRIALGDAQHRPTRYRRARPYSAACAFTSADTWRMARASWSAACAPDTAYFCANTNVRTPEMPLSEASFACAEINSTPSSVAQAVCARRRRRARYPPPPAPAPWCR